MDFKRLISKPCLVLAGLGFLTCLLSSLCVAFVIADYKVSIILGVIMFIVCAAMCYMTYANWSNQKSRGICIVVAILDLAAGFILVFISNIWHLRASYLDHSVVYFFIVIAIYSSISYLWPFVTSFFIQDAIDGAKLERGQEISLYVATNIIPELFLVLIMSLSSAKTSDSRCGNSIVLSIGPWFFAALYSLWIGFIIDGKKGAAGTAYDAVPAASGIAAPIN